MLGLALTPACQCGGGSNPSNPDGGDGGLNGCVPATENALEWKSVLVYKSPTQASADQHVVTVGANGAAHALITINGSLLYATNGSATWTHETVEGPWVW
jgi:hypothetical protein